MLESKIIRETEITKIMLELELEITGEIEITIETEILRLC